jgi:glycosyltransferase involved in cell wall biosynthesis
MEASQLRIALFSGNYNYVRDGANQALNRLVDYLLRQGVAVRVYSPTTPTPAFAPQGDLVSVPSWPMPFGRAEYRFAPYLPAATKRDILAFKPNVFHIAFPFLMGWGAQKLAKTMGVPAVASMHTRFETYLRYYQLNWAEAAIDRMLRRFYSGCDAVAVPNQSTVELMRAQQMSDKLCIWARGIDTAIFNPGQRSGAWRRSLGIGDDEVVVGYLGRLVIEKGLDVFADSIDRLRSRGIAHRVMIVGDGPARAMMAERLPGAIFTGFQIGPELGRATASMDVMLNPSTTEAFGNVMLEGLACGVPVVAARAPGGETLIEDGVSGRLITPGAVDEYADAVAAYCTDPQLRAVTGAAAHLRSAAYDWDRVNHAMIETYLRVLGQHGL